MVVLLAGPNLVLDVGGGRPALGRPIGQGGGSPSSALAGPLDIPGATGWWDAASPDFLTDSAGVPVGGWRAPFQAIANRVPAGSALVHYSTQGAARQPASCPHLSGILGGVGRIRDDAPLLGRRLDQDQGYWLPPGLLPTDSGWTWVLVWSRPGPRSGTGHDNTPVVLLRHGNYDVLSIAEISTGSQLLLFGGSESSATIGQLPYRHTQSVILRCRPSAGIDVWLDDTRVISGAAPPAAASAGGPILVLHDGKPDGGAQCWFHEAALWPRPVLDSEIDALRAHVGRWTRGPRKRIGLLFNGQSNAVNYTLNDGAARLLGEGAAWCLGALDYRIIATTGGGESYTMQSGHGLYPAGAYPGSFLNPVEGTNPGSWPLGADGQALAAALAELPEIDRTDIAAIVWPWNETDSLREAGEGATFSAAARRLLALERAMLGRSAADVPLIWWSAIPYGTDAGMLMHRATVRILAADPMQNIVVGNRQTADSNPRDATWNAISGAINGGDVAHRDAEDNRRFARLAAPLVARAIMAAGGSDSLATIPGDLPTAGGPRIRHVQRVSPTELLLTIDHDRGTDLRLPRQAANGCGFVVTSGNPSAGTEHLIEAVACERVDASHLRVTLAQAMVASAGAYAVHYPYGNRSIGRGNAVTDNYTEIALPSDWDLGSHLGTGWRLDYPLAATLDPVPVSDHAAASVG